MLIGRHPGCEIVIDNVAVSRHHAQILESHGTYFLEDLRSRNGTFLNDVAVEGRMELHETDAVKVCDVVFKFYVQLPPDDESETGRSTHLLNVGEVAEGPAKSSGENGVVEDSDVVGVGDEPSDVAADSSSIITTLNAITGSNLRLGVKPESKLRAVLEISNALGKVLRLDEVLRRILDGLFTIFAQADEGFVLLLNPETNKLIVKATKSRGVGDDDTVRISMTIVKQAMKTGDAILSGDAVSDSRFKASESLSKLQIRSMMCVPLVAKSGDVMGVMQIDTKDVGHQFTQTDLDVLVSVASQASLAVENASLHEELVKQKVMDRDLEFATQIQLGFLPNTRPKVDGYEFYDFYEAALRIGGDFFDYVPLPNRGIGIVLGDVAGKGVPAALLMARLFSSARYQLLTTSSVSEAMTKLNAELASSGLGHRFITCILAIVDPETHVMTIANAGHMPPILRDVEGQVRSLDSSQSGMPLGIDPSQEFAELKLKFQPGESCLLYTDGITEAMNAKSEIYGRKRLCSYISGAPQQIDELVKGMVADVERFCAGRPQRDDICVVGLRRCD